MWSVPPDPQPHCAVRCPKCQQLVITLWTEGEWQFYRCQTHGIIVLSPDQQSGSDEQDDSKVRR